MALVFSLFSINPAPFCLLDEVDAPLDDENTARFINLVNEMSEKVLNIMEFMDDLDDVQEVHTNAEFPDDFEVKN